METLKINLNNIDENKIKKVAGFLENGKICIIPSDTSYALCARADCIDATNKIYQIKKREKTKSLTVFVKNMKMIKSVAEINAKNEKLLKKHLPGSYTFVLNKKRNALNNICADQKTVGVRWVDAKIIRSIFQFIEFPITATSCNISGQAPIYNPKEALSIFQNKPIRPDLLVDGGSLNAIVPSTLIDLTSNVPRVLRQGKEKF